MAVPFEDQEAVLKDVTDRFEKLEIPYMLSGSMAMVCYAMMRMTNDIDIVIEAKTEDAEKIIKEFESDYYIPQDRVRDAISRKFMFNLLHSTKIVKVDCVLRKDDEFQRLAFSNRKKITFTSFDVWTISRDDLILSKLNWAKKTKSEMQMRDIASIIRNGYDEEYVNFWAEKLGTKDLLKDCIELLNKNYVDGYDS
jgi:hypothetical protein